MKRAAIAFALTMAAAALAAQAPVAIEGGTLLTVSHGAIENGVVVLKDGKILAVGKKGEVPVPADAKVVDATGLTVYPGLIDPDTTLGLMEVGSDANARDLSERSDEIMPHMHVTDAFHAETELIPVARLNGVTNAIVAPGDDDSVAGQDALIQLAGRSRDAMIVGSDLALAVNYGPGQRRPGDAFPQTRMGLISQLRQALFDAQHYEADLEAAKKKAAKKDEPKDPKKDVGKDAAKDAKNDDGPAVPPERNLKLEALLPYLHGEKPVIVQVSESYDAETIMKVAREFHLKVVLKGMTHTQDIVDEVASWKVPVIYGSIYDIPQANERYDAVYSLPAELAKRGVKLAFTSADAGGPGGAYSVRNLPYEAGFAVAYGLPYEEALKALTLNTAEIFGVADKLGSLDVGKTANVVLANGDPLDVRTEVKQVFIGGIAQPMVSRQTVLRDEYAK